MVYESWRRIIIPNAQEKKLPIWELNETQQGHQNTSIQAVFIAEVNRISEMPPHPPAVPPCSPEPVMWWDTIPLIVLCYAAQLTLN